jgi:hypothetical protein
MGAPRTRAAVTAGAIASSARALDWGAEVQGTLRFAHLTQILSQSLAVGDRSRE